MLQNKFEKAGAIGFIIQKLLPYLAAIALWLVIWQIAAYNIGIELILPSPVATLKKIAEIIPTGNFALSALSSMRRVLTGFVLGAGIGALIGCISFFVPFAETFFSPILKTVRATPVSSFILIAILWMNSDSVPIFIAFLTGVPIVAQNVISGLKSTPKPLTEAAKMYGLSFPKRLAVLYIPTVLPYFGAACSTSLGLAWKSGIAAEVLCVSRDSIGKNLYESNLYLESAELFAWTVSVIVLSILLEFAAHGVILGIKKLRARKNSPKITEADENGN